MNSVSDEALYQTLSSASNNPPAPTPPRILPTPEEYPLTVPLLEDQEPDPFSNRAPLYSSVQKKRGVVPTLVELANSSVSAPPVPPPRPPSPAYTNVPSPATSSTSDPKKPALPRRTNSSKRKPPSRTGSLNKGLDTCSRKHGSSASALNISGGPSSGGTVSDNGTRPEYTTIPSYPSAGSLLTQRVVPKEESEGTPPLPVKQKSLTETQKSFTTGSTNSPQMYGRHYRAFRDSRRSDRPGGIAYLKFNQQDFYELLDECDSKRRPFNDRSFPPDISSLCYIPFRNMSEIVSAAEGKVTKSSKSSSRSSSRLSSKDGERSPKMGHIVWKRPKELNPRSRLLSGGKMFRGDLVEGVRGTPNFGAACSALALKHELLFQVMPDDQCPIAFEDDWGIYKFRFWRYGNWTEVTIDDKLPSVAGELLYSHTLENDEHWMCVMEKAYAKFNGCYDIINKIPLSDMLQHMTGGITETLTLRTVGSSEQLGCYVENCFKKRALILTTALKSKEGMMLGLDSELPYIVTRVKRRTRVHPCLVCLYSPFGASGWAGPWGRDSPEWRNFSHDDVYNFGLMNESDFDFWISVEDLVEFFETVFIAHQSSDTMAGIVQQLDPSIVSLVRSGVFGNWIKDKTDGGAPNNAKFLTHNIQFLVTQQSIDDKMCVLSLVQRFRPRNTPHEGFMCIGFSVFKAPENIQYRMTDLKEAPVAIATYSYKESVSVRVDLEPGNYVVIPTSYQAGVVGEYLLRCVSPRNLNIRALKQAPPSVTKKQVIDVELLCGENLPDVTHSYDADPEQEVYCVIWCGKDKCQFPIKRGPNPLWNSIATFHAKSPYKRTIFVQVWYKPAPGSSAKEDVCLAETCQLPIITGDHKVVCQLTLSKKTSANKTPVAIPKSSKKGGSRCAGSITLIVRYNPLPTVFRGIPKGGSNVQVVSMDRGRERVMDTSESENSSNRDRKCRTEPRGGVALLNHVALSNQGSISSLVRSGTNSPHRPSVGSNYNADQIILPPYCCSEPRAAEQGLPRTKVQVSSPYRRGRHHSG
ncbi:calpain-5-like isoform X2 [Bolinopsis microptera]|uniref:calpain-5-like isoform X2 n=1 Tax=Bolinopsis microptera TaxID=2820187 RepID=UPI00307AFE0A